MSHNENGSLFGKIFQIIVAHDAQLLESLLKKKEPFSPELITQRVEDQMKKLQLPMSILNNERLEQGVADLNYDPESRFRDETMTAVGAWISPDIIVKAASELPEERRNLLLSGLQIDALIDLRTGQAVTEFYVLPISEVSNNYSLRLSDDKTPDWRGAWFGGPPGLLDPASEYYSPELSDALLGFHNNVIAQVEQAKLNS